MDPQHFITVFTAARHWFLSWVIWIQSSRSHPLTSIPVLFSHLHLGLPSGLFQSSFQTKILYTFFVSMRAICPAHLIFPRVIILTIIGEAYKLCSSSSYSVELRNIHEENNRLNVQNSCYHTFQDLLSSCLVSRNLQNKTHKTTRLPVVLWVWNMVSHPAERI